MPGTVPGTGDIMLKKAKSLPSWGSHSNGRKCCPEEFGRELFHCYEQKFSLGLLSGSWRFSSVKPSKKIQIHFFFPVSPHLRIAVEAEKVWNHACHWQTWLKLPLPGINPCEEHELPFYFSAAKGSIALVWPLSLRWPDLTPGNNLTHNSDRPTA